MRKPVFAICEQQRRKSASASARSLISGFVVHCLDSIIPLVFISGISSLYLASVAAQAGLCLTWSQTPKTGFLVTWFNYWLVLCILMFALIMIHVGFLLQWIYSLTAKFKGRYYRYISLAGEFINHVLCCAGRVSIPSFKRSYNFSRLSSLSL